MRYLYFLLFLALFLYGCTITRQALLDVEACKADPSCYAEMQSVGLNSYVVTKDVVEHLKLPEIHEWIALAVSNVCMFIAGVFKGRKKRTG